MENLKGIKLINPIHIELVTSGNGEFPDSYKLTKEGVKLFYEFSKQCFETGRKRHDYKEVLKNPRMWDEFKFKTFEDYLNSLENGD